MDVLQFAGVIAIILVITLIMSAIVGFSLLAWLVEAVVKHL